MEESKFFKILWRFNAVGLAFCLVVGGLIGSTMLTYLFGDVFGDREVVDMVRTSDSSDVEMESVLGMPMVSFANGNVLLPQYLEQSYSQSYYEKHTASTSNVLFLNPRIGETRWLYPEAPRLIAEQESLVSPGDAVRGFVLRRIEKDSDGDDRLSRKDSGVLDIITDAGQVFSAVAKDVERVTSVNWISVTRCSVVLQAGGENVLLIFDARTGQATKTPILPPQSK